MRACGEDDAKEMVSDTEGVRSLGGREMPRSIRDGMCLCGGGGGCRSGVGGGGGVDGSNGGGGVDGCGRNSGVGDGDESGVYRSGGGGGSVVHGSVGGGLCRSG